MSEIVELRAVHGSWSLVLEGRPLTATACRAILGDRVPVIAWDDSGPGGVLIFPITFEGLALAGQLQDQLNAALDDDFPGEDLLGAPAGYAGYNPACEDFDEPVGGESARVAREEAAWEAQVRSAATRAPVTSPADADHHRYGGWRPGHRFIVHDPDDVARAAAALHLWPTWGGRAVGHVISRCDVHHTGHDVSAGLLVDCDGLPRPIVVSPRVLSVCARKA